MNESDSNRARASLLLCMMAEEQDEALTDVMALANASSEVDLNGAMNALAEINEVVKRYLDA